MSAETRQMLTFSSSGNMIVLPTGIGCVRGDDGIANGGEEDRNRH